MSEEQKQVSESSKLTTEIIHKELDLIQDVIKRMASNSFLLKGWLITLVSIIVALTKGSSLEIDNIVVYIVLFTVILCFWYLDSFFLRTEKLYRELYQWVVKERAKGNTEKLYYLDAPNRFNKKVEPIADIMLSKTLAYFYGVAAALMLLIVVYQVFPK